MDTESFMVYIKTEDIYSDIAKDVETRFDSSNCKLDRPLPKGTNEKIIRLIKDELGGKIMIQFATLGPKTYSYLTYEDNKNKKAKSTKKCVVKGKLKFEDYKYCLGAIQIVLIQLNIKITTKIL